jgi:predicted nucleotidyltransferase
MDKRTSNIIKQFIESVTKINSGLVTAYIFGSYAKNIQRIESDIDIALIIDDLDDADKFDFQVKLLLLASEIDTRIEPHPISTGDFNSNNPFALEIKRTGIEIRP